MAIRICTALEMRELDRIAEEEYGITAQILMENAGRAAVQVIFDHYPQAGKDTDFLIVAGKGNNAGDAFVLARRLLCLDRKVRVFTLADPKEYRGSTLNNFEILRKMNAKIIPLETASELESFLNSSNQRYTLIDGIVGTGLKGDLDGIYYDVVNMLNQYKFQEVISLDIPSGVSGDTGAIHGAAIQAALTISFGFPKLGHFLPPGAAKRGELVNVDISLPPKFRKQGEQFLLRKNSIAAVLKERDRYGHKNSFGHTLLIGGSAGRMGAIVLASRASHKMGTGLVTVATWHESIQSLQAKIADETMSVALKLDDASVDNYRNLIKSYTSVVIGPGLGLRQECKSLMEGILNIYNGPMIIDADGLNTIAEYRLHELVLRRNAPTVLTPHIGEMARLLDIPKEDVVKDPMSAVKRAVEKTHSIVVLKGAATIIGSPDDLLYLNHYPNDGMATAGSGDVLAGMIGGMLSQKIEPFEGTKLGVVLHALSGDFAAQKLGHRSMTSSDIIDNISEAFKDLKSVQETAFPEEGTARIF